MAVVVERIRLRRLPLHEAAKVGVRLVLVDERGQILGRNVRDARRGGRAGRHADEDFCAGAGRLGEVCGPVVARVWGLASMLLLRRQG